MQEPWDEGETCGNAEELQWAGLTSPRVKNPVGEIPTERVSIRGWQEGTVPAVGAQGSMVTGSPIFSILKKATTSDFGMRMHPWEAG